MERNKENRLRAMRLLDEAKSRILQASGFIHYNLQKRLDTVEHKLTDLIEDIRESS